MGKKKGSRRGIMSRWWQSEPSIREEARHAILAVISLAIFGFLMLSWLDYAGTAGQLAYSSLETVFGVGFFVFPALALLLGLSFFQSSRPNLVGPRLIGGALFLFSTLALAAVSFGGERGGWVGELIAWPIIKLFDYYAGVIILVALLAIAIVMMFETRLSLDLSLFGWGRRKMAGDDEAANGGEGESSSNEDDETDTTSQDEEGSETSDESTNHRPERAPRLANANASSTSEDEWRALGRKLAQAGGGGQFVPPPLALLERDSGKPGVGDIKANANTIKRTLANFGIVVEMDEVSIGPSITRYAFKPAQGVKLSRIVGLQNDLSLALAAHPIRIEAPIPGRSLVGIEIPNQTKSRVGLASLLATPEFAESPHPLLISLGRGISGQPHFANLAKAPHLLVAGATGSGKSVVIHTFIASLLFRNPPENLRFLMIDPKRVELTVYNPIPHLLAPVITNAKRAILHLKWAIGEMERRYGILEQSAVRDIQSYHQNIWQPALKSGRTDDLPDRLPYLIIIIDELADIMSAYPRELEATVVRLAQMSRAVGIHLVLSTQRPSVEVITGLIKANIPSRLALQVASQIDSRTIIDMAGAEKLLGAGDLLYLSGEMAKPLRLQSAFISETEVKRVADHLAKQYHGSAEIETSLDLEAGRPNLAAELETLEQADDGDDDELYQKARAVVIESGKASASLLQRRLKVGYARGARLLDMLEERGVIGPGDGAKPREVYAAETGANPETNV